MTKSNVSNENNTTSAQQGFVSEEVLLEDLVDTQSATELLRIVSSHYNIAIRLYLPNGTVFADADVAETGDMPPLCSFIGEHLTGTKSCKEIQQSVVHASDLPETVHCFSGAQYFRVPVRYERAELGFIIIGPFVVDSNKPPESLEHVDTSMNSEVARRLWYQFSIVDRRTIDHIASLLIKLLETVFFQGHKTLLSTRLHLQSITESYEQVSKKNLALEEALQKLKQVDELKSTFLGTVSHELKTPLTSIMGYSEMLLNGTAGTLTQEQTEFVDVILSKGKQLLSLITRLLDLTKLESGTAEVQRDVISIDALIAQAVSTCAPTALSRGITIATHIADDLPYLFGDQDRLRQVLINLIDNAIKFSEDQEQVIVSAELVDDLMNEPGLVLIAPLRQSVQLRVCDVGIGIAPEEYDHIFDPFYQVDQGDARRYPGTGLGLSIVKRLVELHYGSVGIQPNEPRGTIFTVTLPVLRPTIPPPPPSIPTSARYWSESAPQTSRSPISIRYSTGAPVSRRIR